MIKNKEMPKGDPITLAEVSAVLGVKKTSELIPLCHPLPIDHTATKIIMHEEDSSLEVFCVVSAIAKTGVEMEAIMGVNAALITIYDLSKIVNSHLKIDNIKLLIKEGGKSGLWINPDYKGKFGIIAPYSKDFCKSCNRLRITSKGDLRLCLFGNTGISVRHLLQKDDQLNELKDLILKQMQFKKESHYLELGDTGSTKNLSKTGG